MNAPNPDVVCFRTRCYCAMGAEASNLLKVPRAHRAVTLPIRQISSGGFWAPSREWGPGSQTGRTLHLEGPHTWFNALLSLSWNSSSFLKKRPHIFILYYALQSFSGAVYGGLFFFFYPFKFYISREWIQSFCRCCRSFINFHTRLKTRVPMLVSVCRAHIFFFCLRSPCGSTQFWSGDGLDCHDEGVLLTSSGCWPGTLLNILRAQRGPHNQQWPTYLSAVLGGRYCALQGQVSRS